jgi:hypothetical protein
MILYTDDGSRYEGMSEQMVTTLRSALNYSTTFVSQEEYNAIIAANRIS